MHGRSTSLAIGASRPSAWLRGNWRSTIWPRTQVQSGPAALDQSRHLRSLRRARQHVPLCLAAHERLRSADVGNQTFPATAFKNPWTSRIWRHAGNRVHHRPTRSGCRQRGWHVCCDEYGCSTLQYRRAQNFRPACGLFMQ